jgi:uncharacterized membrane protein YgdD (TMEM256/DUF423 family)
MKLNPAWIIAAALGGAFSVALGAIGSHAAGMRDAGFLATASHYGMVHATVLLALAALAGRFEGFAARLLGLAAWLFIAGLVLFSGGLAAVALTGATPVVHVVPFGGMSYILGWVALCAAAVKAWRSPER